MTTSSDAALAPAEKPGERKCPVCGRAVYVGMVFIRGYDDNGDKIEYPIPHTCIQETADDR